MKALVLCEESGIWSAALHRAGFEVIQVDLSLACGLRCREPGWWEYGGDLREFEGFKCDVCCAFPPCTDLACSGAGHWKSKNVYGALSLAACAASIAFGADRGLVENPVGLLSRVLGPAGAIVHPWQFADGPADEEWKLKRTCLWLSRWPMPMFRWADRFGRAPSNWLGTRATVGSRGAVGSRPSKFVEFVSPGARRAWIRSLSWRGMGFIVRVDASAGVGDTTLHREETGRVPVPAEFQSTGGVAERLAQRVKVPLKVSRWDKSLLCSTTAQRSN